MSEGQRAAHEGYPDHLHYLTVRESVGLCFGLFLLILARTKIRSNPGDAGGQGLLPRRCVAGMLSGWHSSSADSAGFVPRALPHHWAGLRGVSLPVPSSAFRSTLNIFLYKTF